MIVEGSSGGRWIAVYREFDAVEGEIKASLEAAKLTTDQLLKRERNTLYNGDKTVFELQLVMESLATLKGRSFFACGGFNQRITRLGIRSSYHLEWVSSSIQQKAVNVVYRQSRRLNQFSASLLESFGGDIRALGSVPEDSVHDGVAPILLENAHDVEGATDWIADRITVGSPPRQGLQIRYICQTIDKYSDNLIYKSCRQF